jgi:hypothetical protein
MDCVKNKYNVLIQEQSSKINKTQLEIDILLKNIEHNQLMLIEDKKYMDNFIRFKLNPEKESNKQNKELIYELENELKEDEDLLLEIENNINKDILKYEQLKEDLHIQEQVLYYYKSSISTL